MKRSLSPRMLGLHLDAKSTIELAARHGFEGVELLIRDLDEEPTDPQDLAFWMADLGLEGGGWPLPVDWRADQDRFRDDLSRLPRYARIASQLGLNFTGTWVLPEILDPRLLQHNDPAEAAFSWHLERLDPIAKILGDYGHRLGLEAIGVASFRSGRGLRFIDRIEQLVPLIGALRDRHRDVGLTLDAFHLFAAGESLESAFQCGFGPDSIVSVHLSDIPIEVSNRFAELRDDQRVLPTAGGIVPNARWLRELAGRKYTGHVFAEPKPGGGGASHQRPDPSTYDSIVQSASEALRALWPTPPSRSPQSGKPSLNPW